MQEYIEELYKKDLYDPDNHDDVIIHLEPDIMECEVKWALGRITTNKASGGDGTPAELFHILKDGVVKGLYSKFQQIWKTQQWPQDWKRSVSFQSQRKAMPKNVQLLLLLRRFSCVQLCVTPWTAAYQVPPSMGFSRQEYWSGLPLPSPKECSNYWTIVLISHASKVKFKIIQARLQKYVTENFQIYKLDLEEAEEPEIKLSRSTGSRKSKRITEKHLLLLH